MNNEDPHENDDSCPITRFQSAPRDCSRGDGSDRANWPQTEGFNPRLAIAREAIWFGGDNDPQDSVSIRASRLLARRYR